MTIVVTVPSESRPLPVATWRHTFTLLLVMVAIGVAGAFLQRHSAAAPAVRSAHRNVLPLYVQLLVMEWALFLFVWRRGLRRSGTSLNELIGGRWGSVSDVLRDLAITGALLGTWALAGAAWDRLVGSDHGASVAAYLPRGAIECALWVLLSLSAGFCEELVFRGYFQRQFAAWTGRRGLAVLLQAVLFGALHGYQGVRACAKIVCFGALYGVVALWIRNLRPGMMGHAMTDILSGIFRM